MVNLGHPYDDMVSPKMKDGPKSPTLNHFYYTVYHHSWAWIGPGFKTMPIQDLGFSRPKPRP